MGFVVAGTRKKSFCYLFRLPYVTDPGPEPALCQRAALRFLKMTPLAAIARSSLKQPLSAELPGLRGRAFLVSAKGFVSTPKPLSFAQAESQQQES